MLEKLTIKNYALISHLELEFGPGLTTLTGETGAGKSIMLGALSMLQGVRADTRAVADGDSKSVVEAIFTDVDPELRGFFDRNDLEWNDGEVIIRREISQNGRSRAFINDRPVTLTILGPLSEQLIDIHSQHANAHINDPSTQLHIIDVMSANSNLLQDYEEDFASFINLRSRIHRLRDSIEKARENSEFMRFQLEQLEKLNPKKGELLAIEKKFEILSDADDLRDRLSSAASLLGGYDRGAVDSIGEAIGMLDSIDMSVFEGDVEGKTLMERLREIHIELKDINESLEDYAGSINSDPIALAKASERMHKYYEAVKRFRVPDADALADLREQIKNKLQEIDMGDGELPELERQYKIQGKKLKEKADLLSASRRRGAEEFTRLLNETARPLGLKNMEFSVSMLPGKLTAQGQDKVEFMCAFNKNQTPGPVAKIASGGEISRLMLSLKRILAGRMNLPTIIFDEVDTGVSGEVADKMGVMMADMGREMQVMAITHQPQVAAKGLAQFKVYKTDGDDRTTTHVRPLSREERIREIASMMSGSQVSESALHTAEVLLDGE